MTRAIASLLQPIGATRVTGGGGDTDIEPSVIAGVPGLSLDTDPSRILVSSHPGRHARQARSSGRREVRSGDGRDGVRRRGDAGDAAEGEDEGKIERGH